MSDEIVVSELKLGSLVADSPHNVIVKASMIAQDLAALVDDRKMYSIISGKKFVKVEGWTTLGAMLGVFPREVETVRLEDGGYLSTVELILIGSGQIIGRGSAMVGMDEQAWGKRNEYARRSMAITRATGKAFRLGFSWIMTLAGYEATPAEEMPDVVEGHMVDSPAPNGGNPEPPSDKAKAEWKKLGEEAAAVGVQVPTVDFDRITTTELRDLYRQIERAVKAKKNR